MAEFEPKKKVLSDFNNGQKYIDGDGLQAKTINDLVESALYAQDRSGSGTGSTILTNYDGDSMEEGFTQYYIKRGAQNRNYYNLGAFDEVVRDENSGDIKIKRATGYYTITRADIEELDLTEDFLNNVNSINLYSLGDINASKIVQGIDFVCSAPYDYALAMKRIGNFIIINCSNSTFSSREEIFDWLVGARIQYPLISDWAFTENVIENYPINNLNQEGNNWLKDEYKKTLNLFNPNSFIYNEYCDGATGIFVSSSNDIRTDYIPFTEGATFQCYREDIPKFNYFRISCFDKNKKYIRYTNIIDNSRNRGSFFVPYDCAYVIFVISIPSASIDLIKDLKIMLTQGEDKYEYAPYNGNLVHQKEFENLSNNLNKTTTELTSVVENLINKINSTNYTTEAIIVLDKLVPTVNSIAISGNIGLLRFVGITSDKKSGISEGTILLSFSPDLDILETGIYTFMGSGDNSLRAQIKNNNVVVVRGTTFPILSPAPISVNLTIPFIIK